MKLFAFVALFVTANAFATNVTCSAPNLSFKLAQVGSEIVITLNDTEKAIGEGLLSKTEIDVIARFPQSGEMTLFAKVGKVSSENYVYILGQHFAVTCR